MCDQESIATESLTEYGKSLDKLHEIIEKLDKNWNYLIVEETNDSEQQLLLLRITTDNMLQLLSQIEAHQQRTQ
jgi:hypothetical protein